MNIVCNLPGMRYMNFSIHTNRRVPTTNIVPYLVKDWMVTTCLNNLIICQLLLKKKI